MDAVQTTQPAPNRVTVTDIDMPFGSMIVFMVKWALAAIPALLILGVMAALIGGLLGAFAGSGYPPVGPR